MYVNLLISNGHLVNVRIVNSKSAAHFGSMCFHSVGNCMLLAQRSRGRHSANYVMGVTVD
jgi:hypothetical protein